MDESLEIPGSPGVPARGVIKGAGRLHSLPRRLPLLTHTHSPDDAAAGDGRVHHWDGFGELALEHTVGTCSQWGGA